MEGEDYGGCSNRRAVNDSLGVPVVPATIRQVAKNWNLWKPVEKIPDAWWLFLFGFQARGVKCDI